MSKTNPEKALRRLLVSKLSDLVPALVSKAVGGQEREEALYAMQRIGEVADVLNQVDRIEPTILEAAPLREATTAQLDHELDQVAAALEGFMLPNEAVSCAVKRLVAHVQGGSGHAG